MSFIIITLFVIGIVGLLFLLCFPVYILIKEERYYQKHDTPTIIEVDKAESEVMQDESIHK